MKHYRFRPFDEILNLVLPRFCCCCGEMLVGDEREICIRCAGHLPYSEDAGVPGNGTEELFQGRIPLVAGASLLRFQIGESSQQIVHEIKYHNNKSLAILMGRLLGQRLAASGRFDEVELLVPVPLHRRKERKRGYNQSALLCEGIAQLFPREIMIDNIFRKIDTESQTHRNVSERYTAMEKVFDVRNPEKLAGKHILVVDDVITTGSTIANCCDALLQIPDVKISVASLARV